MGPEVANRNKDSIFHGDYAGRDLNVTNIIMLEDKDREFVVTHNANIKPVSYFTGRETELQDLRQRIEAGRKSVLVSGMGGIGKTHICRKLFEEYLVKHNRGENEPFQHIGYVEYDGDMSSSLQSCLKFQKQDSPEQNQEAVWKELEHLAAGGKLLLFVDNVDKTVVADPGLQKLNEIPGAIVLTSRRASFGGGFELCPIGFLATKECRLVYEKIRFKGSGREVEPEEIHHLEYIIESLAGRHTITIEFLAHLAYTKHWTVKMLREELEQKGFRLEFHKDGELINIQESYEMLYDLSELTDAEQNILEAFSVFPYIPLSAETCNEWLLADAGVDENADILMGLYEKGWLQFDMAQESYALHPVFAQFIYKKCRPNMEHHMGLIESCRSSLRIPESGSALKCERYIPFAENIVEKIDMGKDVQQAGFMTSFADLLKYTARYKRAQGLYEKCLEIYRSIYGEFHADTASIYCDLAAIYEEQGKYVEAEELYEKSLCLRIKIFGEEHPFTAAVYNNLANVCKNQGRYGKAEELYEKSLLITRSILGEGHPDTAAVYNNLASIYERQGNYKEAEELSEKSVRIIEGALGEGHRYTIAGYNNLAHVYERQGKYGKAERLYKKSLKIREKLLGKEHPDIAASYNNLAIVYTNQGKYEKAEKLYKESLRIKVKALGEEHPSTATSYNGLAYMYNCCGEYEKAEVLYKKSLQIREKVLREEHPDIATSHNNLACVYVSQKRYGEAKELYEKSLRIRERMLGREHPSTAMSYNNLAVVYAKQGEHEIAVDYFFMAYDVFLSQPGISHRYTQTVYKDMEAVYYEWRPEGDFGRWLEEKMKGGSSWQMII